MKKSVTVYYRKLDREHSDFPSETLEEALKSAFGVVAGNWNDRSRGVDDGSSHFANSFNDFGEGLFGDLCAFSQSQMQALLSTAPAQANVDIDEITAPTGQDFLLGMAYWLVIRDHIFLVQAPHLRARQIQDYFDWLLRSATSTLATQTPVAWRAVLDPQEVGDPKDVRSIEVGGLVASKVTPEYSSKVETATVTDWAMKLFSSIFGDERLEQIRAEMPNDTQMSAKVTFTYKKIRRDVDVNMLQSLSGSLQDLPHSQIKVQGKDGTVSNNDARLHMQMRVEKMHPNGVLLDPEDTCKILKRVYERFMEDEKID